MNSFEILKIQRGNRSSLRETVKRIIFWFIKKKRHFLQNVFYPVMYYLTDFVTIFGQKSAPKSTSPTVKTVGLIKHFFYFVKKGFFVFAGMRIEVFVIHHLFKESFLFFVQFIWCLIVDMNKYIAVSVAVYAWPYYDFL